ncbi:hypothetical protein CDGHABPJ_00187 [Pseudomonas phage OMKO1]|nr:hypothetical protein CDGHABPJ_00187 [Pseudomonas phage OMKO1]WNV47730.1 hypothetical protein [Pseudomonas phage fMGyn-Pae01]
MEKRVFIVFKSKESEVYSQHLLHEYTKRMIYPDCPTPLDLFEESRKLSYMDTLNNDIYIHMLMYGHDSFDDPDEDIELENYSTKGYVIEYCTDFINSFKEKYPDGHVLITVPMDTKGLFGVVVLLDE